MTAIETFDTEPVCAFVETDGNLRTVMGPGAHCALEDSETRGSIGRKLVEVARGWRREPAPNGVSVNLAVDHLTARVSDAAQSMEFTQ